jgi:prolipoprotein diacylglyceryltransferase
VPAIAVAQAIGRWGNWFNQELFGRPTTLPWALEVSDSTALKAGYSAGTTFHPTFLYESIGCLLLAFVLIRIESRISPARGRLLAWYVAGYTMLRFFVEGLRVDPAHSAGGLRLNQWVSLGAFSAAVLFLLLDRLRSQKEASPSTVKDHE